MAMALALAGAEPVSPSVGSSMGPVAFAVFLLAVFLKRRQPNRPRFFVIN